MANADIQVDWEKLGKMMLAASQLGLRIEHQNGHRWIIEDPEADFAVHAFEGHDTQWRLQKEYGSFQSALNRIDEALKAKGHPGLLAAFESLNDMGTSDLAVIFGEGVQ